MFAKNLLKFIQKCYLLYMVKQNKKSIEKAKTGELSVFTSTKKLCEYTLKVTSNANKKYRGTVVPQFINTAYKIADNLYIANSIADNEKRLQAQREIDATIKYFSFLTTTAQSCLIVTKRQSAHIATLVLATRKALWQWIHSNPAYKK